METEELFQFEIIINVLIKPDKNIVWFRFPSDPNLFYGFFIILSQGMSYRRADCNESNSKKPYVKERGVKKRPKNKKTCMEVKKKFLSINWLK